MALPTVNSRPQKTIAGAISKWNAANLPIQYVLDNTKWPLNTEDMEDTISTVQDNNGYAQVVLSGTYEGYDVKEWIQITDSTNYNGIHRIRSRESGNYLTLDTAFISADTGTFQRYYNNYTTLIRVYAGIQPTHTHAALDPISLIGTIEQRPEDNNQSKVDIKEFVKSKLSTLYNSELDSWPNDINAWKDFYISYAERYDDVVSGAVVDFTSEYTDDGGATINYFQASESALQFGNSNGGNMASYLADSNNVGNFMTDFERPKIFLDKPFDISIINAGGDELEIKEYDVNRVLLDTQYTDISDQGIGVYRLDLSVYTFNSNTKYITAQIITRNPFTFNVKTDNAGSASDTFILPLPSGGTYDMLVDWGDGSEDTITAYNQAEITHQYSSIGTYTIKITGQCDDWDFALGGDKDKITDISKWGVLGGYWSFRECSNLDISATDNPDFSAFTGNDFNGTFRDCTSLVGNSAFDNWTFPATFKLAEFFQGCTLFNAPVGSWDLTGCTSLDRTFYNCSSFDQDVSSWSAPNNTSINSLFFGCTVFNNGGVSIDSATITPSVSHNMASVFHNCNAFNQPLNSWDVSEATGMQETFSGCLIFNQDLNSWDISKVTTFSRTFRYCTAFNGNITSWNPASVTTFNSMFRCDGVTKGIFNQDISGWTIPSTVTVLGYMFDGQPVFNQNIGGWNTINVTNMSSMFKDCTAFNQDITGWNVSKVTDMTYMFNNADAFNQSIGAWTTTALTTVGHMLKDCAAFDQDLTGWDWTNITQAVSFLQSTTLSTSNYDALLVDIESQAVQNNVTFHGGNSTYTTAGAGGTARAALIADHTWTITDGGGV